MYLSMVIAIYISVSAVGNFEMPCHFVVKFWLSGSFRVRAGVKTSLVTDCENEIILTVAGYGTVKSWR